MFMLTSVNYVDFIMQIFISNVFNMINATMVEEVADSKQAKTSVVI
jgi:hypothetical protein